MGARGVRGVLVAVALLATCAAPASAKSELSILGEGPAAVTAESGKDSTDTYLTILNAGPDEATVAVTFEASASETVQAGPVTPTRLSVGNATRVKVPLTGLETLERDKPLSGELVVTGGAKPVARSVTITPGPQPELPWPIVLVVMSLIVLVAMPAIIAAKADTSDEDQKLLKRAPGPKWKFDSWASNFTVAGAVFGTVLAQATFPPVPREITKDSLVALNILFAVFLVLGPFIFKVIRPRELSATEQETGLWGYNITLVIACSFTLAAVLGQLGALALLAWEVIGDDGWAWVAVAVAAFSALAALRYFWLTTNELAVTDWSEVPPGEGERVERMTVAPDREPLAVVPPDEVAAQAHEIAPRTKLVEVTIAQPVRRTWTLP